MAATTTSTATTTTITHILVFPYPAQGHMPQLLDLTHQLALGGLRITILVTPQNLLSLAPLLTTHPTSIDTLVLPFHHHPKLPLGVENVKDVGNSGNAPIIASLSKLEGTSASIFRKFEEGDPDWEIVKEGMIDNSKSWGYVFNSFDALEGEFLDHVQKVSGHERVFRIGPLNTIGVPKRVNPETKHGVLDWLDTCPDDSVLYICFGSQKLLTEPQIEALAAGLERSKAWFIWVIKSSDRQWVPDRLDDQGVVIRGWAPQMEILSHKAVGAFLSHCGWNSLLESIMAGVILLGWPMEADQFVNAKLLVEYKGLAVKVCEGENTVPDADELARIVNESLGQDIPQKAKAKAMKEKAFEAVKAGGSSATDLDELVKQLSQIGVSNTWIITDLPKRKQAVGSKWVFKTKLNPDGT